MAVRRLDSSPKLSTLQVNLLAYAIPGERPLDTHIDGLASEPEMSDLVGPKSETFLLPIEPHDALARDSRESEEVLRCARRCIPVASAHLLYAVMASCPRPRVKKVTKPQTGFHQLAKKTKSKPSLMKTGITSQS